ncbi:MAG TPA: glycosyltransferase [Candidatus Baltobacteraceae bacterium]
MKVLVVTDQVPGHDLAFQKSGHAQYLGSLLKHFAVRGDNVTLVVFRPKVDFLALSSRRLGYDLIGPSFAHIGASIVLLSPIGICRWIAWKIFARLPQRWQSAIDSVRQRFRRARKTVHHLGTFIAEAEIEFVRVAIRTAKFDLVVYDGIFNSCGRIEDAQHWLLAHEVKHERTAIFARQGVDVTASAVSAEVESRILADVDTVIAIQQEDAREFRRLSPGSRVIVLPATIAMSPRRSVVEATRRRCMFVGSGSYHNYDGISWFIRECWPQIRAAIPAATLDIFGSVCYRLGEPPPGVTLHGVVDDLSPEYASASVTIVPLRVGSGLKVKLVEAFAHEQAIVTTPVGAQGLMEIEPRPFVIAHPSAEFAAATVALLSDPERQRVLRAVARRCAQSFAPDTAFGEFDDALASDTRVSA